MNALTETRFIYDLDLEDINQIVTGWGEPSFRGRQIWQGLYQQLWRSPGEFTSLSKNLRQRLADSFVFSHLTPGKFANSSDGETQKTLFTLPDQLAIETVRMGYARRRTLCISSQAGCAMGCVFCATGQMGFKRNLTSGEIVEQVIYYARLLKDEDEKVTNIVVMGMGEPLHNYDETMLAIDRLNHPDGYNFGARRFTISTVGLVPAIKQFAREKRQINLAVSLHAADDDLRGTMLPISRKYPIHELMDACRYYVSMTHRRVTFEWALIQDVNDTDEQASKLIALLKGLLCHVNVIPLNPTRAYHGRATTRKRAVEFKELLETAGIPCTVRLRRGIDIQAGCGQLAAAEKTV
jgi:23S rRNA (adenine2503-C2)-methyltransferase